MTKDTDDHADDWDQEDQGPPAKKGLSSVIIILLVVGGLSGGCCLIGTIAAIAIPSLVQARKAGNESAAIGSLRTLSSAQAIHRERSAQQQYADSLAERTRRTKARPPRRARAR